MYSLEVVPGGNLVAFGAYYSNQDDLEDNIGLTMMFWLGAQVKSSSTMDTLLENGAKAFFWNDMNHQDDDNIPMVKIDWVRGQADQLLVFA